MRFVKKHLNRHKDEEVGSGVITANEEAAATLEIVRYIQSQVFVEELACVRKKKCVPASSCLVSFSPVLLNGLLVVGGRMRRSKLFVDSKHQIILPRKHHFTTLVLRGYHVGDGHCGPSQMLSSVREKFWIPHGLQVCKRVVRGCFDCKRRRQKPGIQIMADLPEERVTPDNPPFHSVGIDYFGPFFVKLNRSQLKRYGVIFTCLATRAVHFEVAHSLDTDSFLGAFSRFVARRGRPEIVFSDNGTNFIAGERELREMLASWNQEKINLTMAQRQITWKFNPPTASHMGGAWERLIRSARDILKAMVKEQVLRDETLLTFIAEAERIMNDRPITALSDDVDDPQPLTPAMLLLLKPNKCLPVGTFTKADCYPRRWWRHAQWLADMFWRRWLHEYLPTLQARQKWQKPMRDIAIDDIVLMVEKDTPRGRWPLAIVVAVHPSEDGFVRSCTVRCGKSVYDRPIHKLCLLEQAE